MSTNGPGRVAPEAALEALLACTGAAAGPVFFPTLVRHLARAFQTRSVVLARWGPGPLLHPLAVWSEGGLREEEALAPQGTAFEQVLQQEGLLSCPEGADTRFPEDAWLRRLGPRGFLGRVLKGARGEALGVLALLSDSPLEVGAGDVALLEAFATRAGAELDRLQAQAALVEARDFLRRSLSAIPDPLFVKDVAHRFVIVNEAFCRFMGRPEEELLGRTDHDFVAAEEADVFWQRDAHVFESGQPDENEESWTAPDGETRTLVTTKALFTGAGGQPFLVGVIRDVTQHKRLEAQLRLADRMATVGTMASGVAHEINNPLSYVTANLSFLREQLAGDNLAALDLNELREVVAEALDGTGRVRAIVQDLKRFTRSDEQQVGPVELGPVIEGARRLVRHQLQHHATLVCELEPVPAVLGNPARLGQVLVNLMVNALQAFPKGDPEHNLIRISVRRSGAAEVLVEVEDNGQGMTLEVQKRLFSPFFTTKPTGVGTGLGLSISHSIIESVGGRIEVRSASGKGSVFRVVLPVFVGRPYEVRPLPQPSVPSPLASRRLLVVDDEPAVGASVRHLLQGMHEVDIALDARDALQRIERGTRYDAILCDMVLPGLSGMDFVAELERREPRLARRTGLMTGAVITPLTRAFIAARASDYLQKPFEPDALRRFVERLLS